MHVDTESDVVGLREGLRDLVALSAIPAIWIGSEPPAVAAGLADALVGLLRLDFAFVRLSDPGGAGAVEVTRGNAWASFPEWLEGHLAASAAFPRKEIVPDIGDDAPRRRGLAVPVGVNGEGGVVAAASERSDFPTPMDEMLLSVAANHAAGAFQNARLILERKRAEDELRQARNELEMKVAERTAELGRSEAYLAEAQRLTHTGSFAIDVSSQEVTHSSDEHSRLFGFDPEGATPSLDEFLQRIHPQDLALCTEAIERGIRQATNIEVEYRVVLPQSPVRHHRALAHPVFDASGELDEFVGTIVDVTERRRAETELERLAGEQAALRRVATLVAKESPPAEVFAKVAEELANVLGDVDCSLFRDEGDGTASAVALWGAGVSAGVRVGTRLPIDGDGVIASVLREGRPCRIGDYSGVTGAIAQRGRELGIASAVGCPILVRGRIWGALGAARYEGEAFPREIETRIAQFAELVATTIANAEARTEVERLAAEQAALRRVATLVARDAPQAEVFTSIAEEVRRLFGNSLIYMFRYEDDRAVVAVASAGIAEDIFPVGSRHELGGKNAATRVFESGEPVRIDDYATANGPLAEAVRPTNTRAMVGTPLVIDGRLWGVMVVGTREEPLPPETEVRLGQFTELMATTIANTESRAEVERLADEQAALRRVATLVAEGAAPGSVFDAVAGEMEALLEADQVALNRFEPGDEVIVLAHRGLDVDRSPVGSRLSIEGESATARVRRTGQPARMESYESAKGPLADLARATGLRASVSAPIRLEGKLWGIITASWKGEGSPPGDTEERMARFAGLLDTAIANADSRDQLVASRARLVAASDEARRRFERDLHDGAQQRLVSLSLELSTAEAMAPPENEELAGQLAQVGDGLRGALEDLRELSHGIHPAILSEGGLVPALKALARRSAVPLELDLAVAEQLAERVEVGAYYVVSEALTNAAKHAQASKVKVRARAKNGKLELRIDDDGVGGADPGGHGLVGMGDRVTALGGRLEIDSPPGGGTLVIATLPLSGF